MKFTEHVDLDAGTVSLDYFRFVMQAHRDRIAALELQLSRTSLKSANRKKAIKGLENGLRKVQLYSLRAREGAYTEAGARFAVDRGVA